MTVTAEGLSEAIVTQAIEAVVAEKGADYTYDAYRDGDEGMCLYVKNGAPSCIVGHVMARLGYPLDSFVDIEGQIPVTDRFRGVFPGLSDRVAAALDAAQQKQDNNATWGEALTAYKNTLNNYNNETENN